MLKNKHYRSASAGDLFHLKSLWNEKVRMLFANVWQPAVAGILAAILLVILEWNEVEYAVLLVWLVAVLLLYGLRLSIAVVYLRLSSARQEHPYWLRLFALIILATGCVWGAGGVLLFDSAQPEKVAALAIILCGVSAGCVTMLSSIWWLTLLFILPILIPLQLMLVSSSSPAHTMLAALSTLFVLTLIATSHRLGRLIHDNIELSLKMAAREAQLLESENRYLSIFQHSPLGVLHFDKAGYVTDCNDKLLDILAIERTRLLGLCMLHEVDADMALAVQNTLMKATGYYEGNFLLPCNTSREGGTPVHAFFNGVRGVDDEIVGGVAIVEDFTERKRNEAVIYRQAYYDALTDLPNRRLFIERLVALCDQRHTAAPRGLLMFLDLDHFKLINDTWGHAVGDELLVQVANRLKNCLGEGDVAARLSGDEFVLLALLGDKPDDALEAFAETYMGRLQQSLSEPYRLANCARHVTPSIGYTCFIAPHNHEELLKQADIAMYHAKMSGRARLSRYQPWMHDTMQ